MPCFIVSSHSNSFDEIQIVIPIDNFECMVWIVLHKSIGQAWLLGAAPFKLISMQYTVIILNIIHLLLLLCAPEITFAIKRIVCVVFHTLTDEVILP